MGLPSQLLSSTLSFWRGTGVSQAPRPPPRLLHLYDIEGSADCRLVREAITELDLDVVIYPCPKGGNRFRSLVMSLGGKDEFPYLVDPNSNRSLYGYDKVLRYLFEQYGGSHCSRDFPLSFFTRLSSLAGTVVRHGAGKYASPSRRHEFLLELYSFESSPYARPVRELMCELELPYVLHNVGKAQWDDYLLPFVRDRLFTKFTGSTESRGSLFQNVGRVSVPYLVDPNSGTALFESGDILAYLRSQYAI